MLYELEEIEKEIYQNDHIIDNENKLRFEKQHEEVKKCWTNFKISKLNFSKWFKMEQDW